MIYFLRCERTAGDIEAGWIKIGTTIRLSQRSRALSVANEIELRVLAVLDGGHVEEHSLHLRFSHLRAGESRHCEWFEPGGDLLDFIAREGRPWEESDDAPPTLDGRVPILSMKVSREFDDWLKTLADHCRTTSVNVMDLALVHYAKHVKFPEAAPKRTRGR